MILHLYYLHSIEVAILDQGVKQHHARSVGVFKEDLGAPLAALDEGPGGQTAQEHQSQLRPTEHHQYH